MLDLRAAVMAPKLPSHPLSHRGKERKDTPAPKGLASTPQRQPPSNELLYVSPPWAADSSQPPQTPLTTADKDIPRKPRSSFVIETPKAQHSEDYEVVEVSGGEDLCSDWGPLDRSTPSTPGNREYQRNGRKPKTVIEDVEISPSTPDFALSQKCPSRQASPKMTKPLAKEKSTPKKKGTPAEEVPELLEVGPPSARTPRKGLMPQQGKATPRNISTRGNRIPATPFAKPAYTRTAAKVRDAPTHPSGGKKSWNSERSTQRQAKHKGRLGDHNTPDSDDACQVVGPSSAISKHAEPTLLDPDSRASGDPYVQSTKAMAVALATPQLKIRGQPKRKSLMLEETKQEERHCRRPGKPVVVDLTLISSSEESDMDDNGDDVVVDSGLMGGSLATPGQPPRGLGTPRNSAKWCKSSLAMPDEARQVALVSSSIDISESSVWTPCPRKGLSWPAQKNPPLNEGARDADRSIAHDEGTNDVELKVSAGDGRRRDEPARCEAFPKTPPQSSGNVPRHSSPSLYLTGRTGECKTNDSGRGDGLITDRHIPYLEKLERSHGTPLSHLVPFEASLASGQGCTDGSGVGTDSVFHSHGDRDKEQTGKQRDARNNSPAAQDKDLQHSASKARPDGRNKTTGLATPATSPAGKQSGLATSPTVGSRKRLRDDEGVPGDNQAIKRQRLVDVLSRIVQARLRGTPGRGRRAPRTIETVRKIVAFHTGGWKKRLRVREKASLEELETRSLNDMRFWRREVLCEVVDDILDENENENESKNKNKNKNEDSSSRAGGGC